MKLRTTNKMINLVTKSAETRMAYLVCALISTNISRSAHSGEHPRSTKTKGREQQYRTQGALFSSPK